MTEFNSIVVINRVRVIPLHSSFESVTSLFSREISTTFLVVAHRPAMSVVSDADLRKTP